MIDIKAILKKHNITREDMLRNDWQVKILYLVEDAIGETIVACTDREVDYFNMWQQVKSQFTEIKNEVKPLPEAWDK